MLDLILTALALALAAAIVCRPVLRRLVGGSSQSSCGGCASCGSKPNAPEKKQPPA